jgi:heme a synthase
MTPQSKKFVRLWLWSGVFLVTLMVAVGGITRLTGSGLSIARWDIITGTLPPLTQHQWNVAFEQYKETPQFRQINSKFTLDQFKGIFWWEYFHRLAGRLIGLVFIIPFVILLSGKMIPSWLVRNLWVILLLGAAQGVMGWVMVKSGLSELPYVSHYRLAMHLSLALILIGALLWTIRQLDSPPPKTYHRVPIFFWLLTILLFIQIIFGAFVAGLKAGYYYNTWPLMGENLVPENVFASFNNGVLLQFIHRWFAWVVAIVATTLWLQLRSHPLSNVRSTSLWLMWGVFLQILIGIFTLLFKVPILLGVLHQLVAVALFGLLVSLIFLVRLYGSAEPAKVRNG